MISLLVESTVRTLLFAGVVGLILKLGRVRDVATRLTAWTCVLYGALLLPAAATFLPPLAVTVAHRTVSSVVVVLPAIDVPVQAPAAGPAIRVDWRVALCLIVSMALLGRLAFGLMIARRLRRAAIRVIDARALKLLEELVGIGRTPRLVESAALTVPIATGWMRPAVILPDCWREWDDAKMRLVLAHELSHVRRGDYGTLLLASIYRAIFWFNPLSWWLDRQLRDLAEQASDDSALRSAVDRTQYADVLLGFFESLRGRRGRIRWEGVAMARGSRAGRRIDLILAADRKLSAPVRWTVMAGIALLCVPVLYLAGALRPVVVMAQSHENTANGPGYSSSSKHLSSDKSEDSYMIVSGDNMTMSGSSSDMRHSVTLRKQLGDNFIWFRRDGKGYVIRDAGILSAAHKLFEPQEELGRRQSELGEQQSKLGDKQAELGDKQSSVRTTPKDLTREIEELKKKVKTAGTAEELGDVQALLGEIQSKIADQQARIGEGQSKLGDEQAKLGDEQARLGEQQAKLGEEQARRGEEAARGLKKLIDEAVKKGLAEPEPR